MKKNKENQANHYYNQGIELANLNDFVGALQLYNKAVEFGLINSEIFLNIALVSLKMGKMEEAIKYSEKAIELEPDNYYGYFYKGLADYELKEFSKSIDAFNKAIEFESCAELYYSLGLSHGALEQYSEAIMNFDYAIKLNPNDYQFYYKKASCLVLEKKDSEAIELYEKAIELNSYDAALYSDLGLCLVTMDSYNKALDCYDKSIELKPNNSYTYYYKGLCLKTMGDIDNSLLCYNKAIELDPNNIEAIKQKNDILEIQKENDNEIYTISNIVFDNSLLNKPDLLQQFQDKHGIYSLNQLISISNDLMIDIDNTNLQHLELLMGLDSLHNI